MEDLLIECSSCSAGSHEVYEVKFHIIFYKTVEHLIQSRKSNKPTEERNKLVQDEREFVEYAESITVSGKYKSKCEALKAFYSIMINTLYEIATKSKQEQRQAMLKMIPDPVNSFIASGVVINAEYKERLGKLWVKLTALYLDYVSDPSSKNEIALKTHANMFGVIISGEISVHIGEQNIGIDFDVDFEIPLMSEIEQDNPFIIAWSIGDDISVNPSVVTINWSYVSNMLGNVLGRMNNYDKSPRTRQVIKAFLDWYGIMKGSNASILSPQIRDWIIVGRQHVRNIVVILDRMPSQVTNYGQAKRDFLGCRSALGTWYIGIIDALLMTERNPTNRSYLQSFVNDMKKYCR
jgi:hypothetical protein